MTKKTRSEIQRAEDLAHQTATIPPAPDGPTVQPEPAPGPDATLTNGEPSGNGHPDAQVNPVGAMVPTVPSEPAKHAMIDPRVCGTVLTQRPTSVDLSTPRGKAIAFNAIAESTVHFDDNGACLFAVSNYILHPGLAADPETGEIREFLWLTFIDPRGETFSTTSEVVMHRFSQLLSWHPDFPKGGPITVRITERRSRRSKNTYHQLYMVPPEE